jgi:hypothetical protein
MQAKRAEFQVAIRRYENVPAYRRFGHGVAVVVILFQFLLLRECVLRPPAIWSAGLLVLLAWPLVDFVNGFVHLLMDHADQYGSPAGPLIANFHLHHRTPRYRRHPLPVVYFLESGSKVWLAVLLPPLWWATRSLAAEWTFLAAVFGILSSLAEVSHYLCHTSRSPVAEFLAWTGILLSRKHHEPHHRSDNANYAFLNGMTDPVLNWIARRFFTGYKEGTDLHFSEWTPATEGERYERGTR